MELVRILKHSPRFTRCNFSAFFHHINGNTRELSSIMLPSTRNLQTVGIDVGTTMQSLDDLVIALEAMRCEEVFSKMFTSA